MSARVISIVLGLIFIGVGVLGFVPGQEIVSSQGLFKVDFEHNLVHLISGLLLILLPFIMGGKQTLLLVGVIYAAIALLGFLHPLDPTLIPGHIAVNEADRFLHVILAAILLLAGLVFSNHSNSDA
jgi:Domain of unknown function (DUF4383)